MPISGLHHLGLTVSDLEVSAAWYETVLGFYRVGRYASPGGERQKVFLRQQQLDVRLGLTQHGSGSSDAFDETHVGLDHLSFAVDSEPELLEWQAHFARHGVRYTPVTRANSIPGASVLVFRDPDNIQLELFFDPADGNTEARKQDGQTELRANQAPPEPRVGHRERPAVHYTSTDGWINDPYGIIWFGSSYHLFYQAIPGRVTWAPNCRWGHAVSSDLVRWRESAVALTPQDTEVGCWSGTVILDDAGAPTIVYTSIVGDDWGQGRVALAHPDPAVGAWSFRQGDTVITGPPARVAAHSFRDPFVWRSGQGWTMVIGAGLADGSAAVLQYRSTDLRDWTYDGIACKRRSTANDEVWTGSLWECPQLFQLGHDWVLLVSVWDDDSLHYVAAAVGEYDGRRFTPRGWQRLTYGSSAYAMTAFTDKLGRRCVMSWLREEPQNNRALTERAGAHSVVATLASDSAGRLRLAPHPDLDSLIDPTQIRWTANGEPVSHLEVTAKALMITISSARTGTFEIHDIQGLRLRVEMNMDTGVIELLRPGLADEHLPAGRGSVAQLKVLLDADVVEIFSAHAYGAVRIRPAHDPTIQLVWSTPEPPEVYRLHQAFTHG